MRWFVGIGAAAALSAIAAPLFAQDYLDNVVERARKEFQVPGIAVAVVKDGKVVALRGMACVTWASRLP